MGTHMDLASSDQGSLKKEVGTNADKRSVVEFMETGICIRSAARGGEGCVCVGVIRKEGEKKSE